MYVGQKGLWRSIVGNEKRGKNKKAIKNILSTNVAPAPPPQKKRGKSHRWRTVFSAQRQAVCSQQITLRVAVEIPSTQGPSDVPPESTQRSDTRRRGGDGGGYLARSGKYLKGVFSSEKYLKGAYSRIGRSAGLVLGIGVNSKALRLLYCSNFGPKTENARRVSPERQKAPYNTKNTWYKPWDVFFQTCVQ